MGHKIIITGHPLRFRDFGEKVALDICEKGSSAAPKGLPTSGGIRYTCLMTKKQFSKLQISQDDIKNHRLLIKGEPTLDLSARECSGEIGVIVYEIDIAKPRENHNSTEDTKTSLPTTAADKALINLEEITIPQEFLEKTPSKFKTLPVIEYVRRTGTIDKPVIIDPITKQLVDGYRRYYVAKMFNLKKIPYVYPEQIA